MKTAPSATFRHLCLALALVAVTWAFPASVNGDFYPLQTVQSITDTLKPNVLVLLETAESMQGIPGESPARYNSIGADCEDGSRYCRLVNQDGRYPFSGMGQNGIYFGGTPPSCTHTETKTDTAASNSTTSTASCTALTTTTTAVNVNGSGTATGAGTATKTTTGTGCANAVATATASGSIVVSGLTVTGSAQNTATGTAYPTGTRTVAGTTFSNATQTMTVTRTTTATAASAVVLTGTVTVTRNATLSDTVTASGTSTLTLASSSQTTTATQTISSVVTITGTVTRTGTVTGTGGAGVTVTDNGTVTGLVTITSTAGPSAIATGNGTGTYQVINAGATMTVTALAGPYTTTQNGIVTTTQTITATAATSFATTTQNGTAVGSISSSNTQTVVASAAAGAIAGSGTGSNASGTSAVTATYVGTGSGGSVWTYFGTWVQDGISNSGSPRSATRSHAQVGNTVTAMRTDTTTATDASSHTTTATITRTSTAVGNAPNVNQTATNFSPGGCSVNCTATFTGTWTDPSTGQITFTATYSGTQTAAGNYSSSSYASTATVTATITGTTNVTIANSTVTATATVTEVRNPAGNGQWVGNETVTAAGNVTATGAQTVSGSATATGSVTYTGTVSASGSISTSTNTSICGGTQLVTGTSTDTVSYSTTAVETKTDCTTSGGSDLGRCDQPIRTSPLVSPNPTTQGYCNDNGTGAYCGSDSACSDTKGEYCRRIAALDDLNHARAEPCFTSPGSGSAWGSCKRGRVTANTDCGPWSDASCNSSADQDFCAEGKPAKMCMDSGLWCLSSLDCPTGDPCVPASSRMMTVKRALRRAVTDYGDKVNFGFMNTYQAPASATGTCTDTSTCIYPYVKLASCPATIDVTETKLFTRGELERLGAFTILRGNPPPTDGPASSFTWNGVSYTKTTVTGITSTGDTGSGDSRWIIPRTDGSGKFDHYTANWTSCPGTSNPDIRPACTNLGSKGTGIYEGSYYTFTYKRGTPVADGTDGSMQHPMYSATYLGKYFYVDATHCYNLIDAERTDIVNDGVYNRRAYVLAPSATSPYTVTGTGTGTSVAVDTSKETYVDPPWAGAANVSTCNSASGGIWNANAVPFLNQTGSATATGTATDRALAIAARLDKASLGGVAAIGNYAPIGCALSNSGSSGVPYGAAAYMSQVKDNDAANNGGNAPCWTNNIILVVDGHANGPGDQGAVVDCASSACASSTPDEAHGCHCLAINNAYALAQAGVETHVVVNAPANWASWISAGYPYYTYAFMWNLALAGSRNSKFYNANSGTPSFGTSEEEVYQAISTKIAAATYKFTYTTAGAVAGATTQDPTTQILTYSNMLYDTSIDYPSFKGTVRAFDTTSSVQLGWDAAGVATGSTPHPGLTSRRIYFSNKSGDVVKVNIGTDWGISNKDVLHSAGLGAGNDEAEIIMQWLLGKPERGNPAPLMGAISSSTPIVVGQPAANGLSGSPQYSEANWKRPPLLYVGGDDGMLHAFFAHVGEKTYGGTKYYGGEEAFAFIPNDMLPVITKLYAQGGQRLPFDKSQHIFGLASSPKVKDMCSGSCSGSTGSDWHTVLVMPEGPGGNKPFALDITDVIGESTGLHAGNMTLLWSTALMDPGTTNGGKWDQALGETTSVPAFYFAGYPLNAADNRVVFASGYRISTSAAAAYANQGLTIVNADAWTGVVKDNPSITAPQATSCTQTHALIADVALARDYASAATSQYLMAAYLADTWGNTYQYVPTATTKLSTLYTLGSASPKCDQPIYYAPAVVQLDRAPRVDTSSKHIIFLVQVTGSAMDPVTSPVSSSYPPSQLVVTKLDGNVTPPSPVTSYNKTANSASFVLNVGTDMCLQSGGGSVAFTNGMKTASQSCTDAGGVLMPSSARPVGTPSVALRSDGLGFQAITAWYDPTSKTNNCSSGSFSYGQSYVTVHEFGADGTWYQIAGVTLNNTALTGIAFIGTGLFIDGLIGDSTPASINIGQTFSKTQQIISNSGLDRYQRTTWTERLE
jgi:hypothetical protein